MSEIPKVGQIFDARYKIEEVLGSGGYGTVYKALQLDCQRAVALKVLHGELADEVDRARFVREAQTLNRLSHANIVTVYHLGVSSSDLPYLAMEYVKGKSLRELMSAPLPTARSLKLAREIAQTMDYVHKCNVVHRDLKPENILVLQSPSPDTIKLLDFGLVKLVETDAVDQNLTNTGYMMGSISYMSPEQCLGKKVDFRTDIYSLTLILYEMVRGKAPFEADNPVGMAYKHINEPVPQLAVGDVDVFHPHLNTLIATGMAKDPDKRFASMAAMIEEIESTIQLCASAGVASKPKSSPVFFPLLLVAAAAAGTIYWAAQRPDTADLPQDKINKPAESSDSYKRKIASLERAYGPNSVELAKNLKLIADQTMSNYGPEDIEQARPLYLRALAICRKSLPKGAQLTTRILYQLGFSYSRQPAKAIPYYEEALASDSDMSTIADKYNIRSHLIACYAADKQLEKAIPMYDALLKDPVLSKRPPDPAMVSVLMRGLYSAGRSNEARSVFLNAQAKDPKWHREKQEAIYALVSNEKGELADKVVQDTISHFKQVTSGDEDIQCLTRFAQIYREQDQKQKAAPLIEEAFARCSNRTLPSTNIHVYATYDLISFHRWEHGNVADAEKYLRKVLECEKVGATEQKRTQIYGRYANLVQILDEQHRFREAEKVLMDGIASMENDPNTDPQELNSMRERLLVEKSKK